MPIVMGAGLSHSPLIYRERQTWDAVYGGLRSDAIQPASAALETAERLDAYALRISQGLATLEAAIARSRLDALIVISADRASQFDSSHVPQIHLQSGGEIWGDTAITELGEPPRRQTFRCESEAAALLVEELVRSGFDAAEATGAFAPVGDANRGWTPAAAEAVGRLAGDLPVIPFSLNCHVAPMMGGRRAHALGVALARAASLTALRLGVLVSGGLSGDPGGPMAGWIDDVFDQWVLARISRGRSVDLSRIFDVKSRTLLGATREIRLWTTAAAALEASGGRATIHDYLVIHHAATGVAFVTWEV